MEVNVPQRDELGRFTAWAKKKGEQAVEDIKRGAGNAARSLSVGADKVADKLGAAPQVRPGMETDEELEAAEPKLRMDRISRPVETGAANAIMEHVEAPMMKKTVERQPGPAKKPSYKPWSMEKKRGW